jgi:hypothetical protein
MEQATGRDEFDANVDEWLQMDAEGVKSSQVVRARIPDG